MIRRPRFIAAIAFAALCILPQVFHRLARPNPYIAHPSFGLTRPLGEVARIVSQYADKDQYMGLWGFRPRYYIETQMPHATREANSYLQIRPSPLRDYSRKKYLERFSYNLPPVFVDSVGPGDFFFTDRDQAHECFPALADIIRRCYTLVAEVDGSRIYARNDRISTLPAQNTNVVP